MLSVTVGVKEKAVALQWPVPVLYSCGHSSGQTSQGACMCARKENQAYTVKEREREIRRTGVDSLPGLGESSAGSGTGQLNTTVQSPTSFLPLSLVLFLTFRWTLPSLHGLFVFTVWPLCSRPL